MCQDSERKWRCSFWMLLSVVVSDRSFVRSCLGWIKMFSSSVMEFPCCHTYIALFAQGASGKVDHRGAMANAFCWAFVVLASFNLLCFPRFVISLFVWPPGFTSLAGMQCFLRICLNWWFSLSETNGILRERFVDLTWLLFSFLRPALCVVHVHFFG